MENLNPNPTVTTSDSIAQAAGVDPINTTHPYYISSSDSPGMPLVNTAFDGKGFVGWKHGILIALTAKNKAGFIDGSSPEPTAESELHNAWLKANNMVNIKMKRLWDELDSLDASTLCTLFLGD